MHVLSFFKYVQAAKVTRVESLPFQPSWCSAGACSLINTSSTASYSLKKCRCILKLNSTLSFSLILKLMTTLDKIVLICHQIAEDVSMICLILSRILYTRLDGRNGVASTLTGTPGGRPPPTPTGTTGRGTPSGAVRVPALCSNQIYIIHKVLISRVT